MDTRTVAPPQAPNGLSPRDLYHREKGMVLKAFERARGRGGNVELRVAIRVNPETNEPEITYIGIHEKINIDSLHHDYKLRRVRNDDGVLVLQTEGPS